MIWAIAKNNTQLFDILLASSDDQLVIKTIMMYDNLPMFKKVYRSDKFDRQALLFAGRNSPKILTYLRHN